MRILVVVSPIAGNHVYSNSTCFLEIDGLTIMEIVKNSSGDVLELKLRGSFDHESSVHFRESIEDSARSGWHRILIDLGDVDYISSAGLGALVSAKKKITRLNGQFGAHNPTAAVAKVMQLTRLHDTLIVDPDTFATINSNASAILDVRSKRFARANSIDMEIYSLNESKPMTCSIFGKPAVKQRARSSDETSYCVPFGRDSLGLGLGVLASENDAEEGHIGEIFAISGAVAKSAPDTGQLPDYSLARGDFTPSANFLYGAKLEGSFSTLIRFRSSDGEASIELSKLVRSCMEEQKVRTAAFAILADCSGLLGAQMKQWIPSEDTKDPFSVPEIRDWLSFCPEHSHQHKLALIVGLATLEHDSISSLLQTFLRPLDDDANYSGHFHAAVFPYQPLKKRTIDLQAFIGDLFESSEIQEVMHLLRDARPVVGDTESELKSGACWIQPIDDALVKEVQT